MKLGLNKSKGFTLIEVLLVVAILAILAGIVIIAVNPSKQLEQSQNAERRADVNTILNAVYQYSLENEGNIPSIIPSTATTICATGGDCTLGTSSTADDYIDLSILTTNEEYLTAIPEDPDDTDADGTGYTIVRTTNDRVTVAAPNAENGETISATR